MILKVVAFDQIHTAPCQRIVALNLSNGPAPCTPYPGMARGIFLVLSLRERARSSDDGERLVMSAIGTKRTLACAPRTLMPIRAEGPRRVWNLLTSQTFSFGASLLHIEVAQVSIGAPNEYFLHHRRRRRSACYCRILWCARLNKKFGGPALKHRDAVEIAQQA